MYEVRDASTSEKVGTLWFAVRSGAAGRDIWIYDIEILAPFRRMGYAASALGAAERKAAGLGAERVWLHVFGHNAAARALYEGAGYSPSAIVMSKRIDAG